jgi:hypothetical protein
VDVSFATLRPSGCMSWVAQGITRSGEIVRRSIFFSLTCSLPVLRSHRSSATSCSQSAWQASLGSTKILQPSVSRTYEI